MLVILALCKLRQKDHEFEASLEYIVKSFLKKKKLLINNTAYFHSGVITFIIYMHVYMLKQFNIPTTKSLIGCYTWHYFVRKDDFCLT
jgi:hypothetical protein